MLENLCGRNDLDVRRVDGTRVAVAEKSKVRHFDLPKFDVQADEERATVRLKLMGSDRPGFLFRTKCRVLSLCWITVSLQVNSIRQLFFSIVLRGRGR